MNVNDKVVCVNDRFWPEIANLYTDLPIKGRTYVIRDVRIGIDPLGNGSPSLLLVGLVNPKANSFAKLERGFVPERFVPLSEYRKETSVHAFDGCQVVGESA